MLQSIFRTFLMICRPNPQVLQNDMYFILHLCEWNNNGREKAVRLAKEIHIIFLRIVKLKEFGHLSIYKKEDGMNYSRNDDEKKTFSLQRNTFFFNIHIFLVSPYLW